MDVHDFAADFNLNSQQTETTIAVPAHKMNR